MPRFNDPHETIETLVVMGKRVGSQYIYEGAQSRAGLEEPEAPHAKATVDARPYVQKAAYKTYWYDPDKVGRSPETIYYTVNPAPTKTTPGTDYSQVLYYRFTVGIGTAQKTYQYKRTVYWLKDVEGTSPDEPWLASSDITDEIYFVNNVTNQLVAQNGQTKPMEPVI